MSSMKKLLESIDAIEEGIGMTSISNPENFVRDMVKAFGGQKDKTLSILVTLKGNNILEYQINVGTEGPAIIKDLQDKLQQYKELYGPL